MSVFVRAIKHKKAQKNKKAPKAQNTTSEQ